MPTTNKEGMLLDQKPTDVESLGECDDVDWDHGEEKSDPNLVDEPSLMASEERSSVTWLREVVFGILLVAGALVCVIVYHILISSEHEESETYYDGAAAAVVQVRAVPCELVPRNKIRACSLFQLKLTNYCSSSGIP
jgi:hypothetical protein